MHQVHLAPEAEPSEPTCGSPPPAPEAVPAAPTLDISFAHLIVQFNQIPHILQSEHLTPLEKQDVLATWASSQVTALAGTNLRQLPPLPLPVGPMSVFQGAHTILRIIPQNVSLAPMLPPTQEDQRQALSYRLSSLVPASCYLRAGPCLHGPPTSTVARSPTQACSPCPRHLPMTLLFHLKAFGKHQQHFLPSFQMKKQK